MTNKYDDENIFAKIIKKEIPAKVVFEDEQILAFEDVNPAAPIHILIIPKNPYTSYADFVANADIDEVAYFFKKIKEIADMFNLGDGFRLITNNGRNASQTVEHFHFHMLAGKPLGGLLAGDKLNR